MTVREPTWSNRTRQILQAAVAADSSATADLPHDLRLNIPDEPARIVCSSCGATLLQGPATVTAALLQHLQPCTQDESGVAGYSMQLPPTAVLLDECDRVDEMAGRHGGFVTTARIRQLLGVRR